MLCGISSRFQLLSPSERQVAHALLTRPPLSQSRLRRISVCSASFDLHVLGTPPAFILSQDQTLNILYLNGTFVPIKSIEAFQLSKESFVFSDFLKEPFSGAYLHKLFLHCSIFKVHSLAPFRDSLISLTRFQELVKRFFEFLFPSLTNFLAFPQGALLIYHRKSSLSTLFLIFFGSFFEHLNIAWFIGHTTQYVY